MCFANGNFRRALVLGGARSGKSRFAEQMVRETGLPRVYIATAQAFDGEMAARIALHREERGPEWQTIEAPRALAATLAEVEPGRAVLVDCLTLWLSNVMLDGGDVAAESAALLEVLAAMPGPVVLVSNELGMGLVPETALGRAFRDAQGRLNQQVAALADRAVFVAAGLPLVLKGGG
ncbi:bifunctional adenosylcobinamide kinase/adenosylcobinamide-phosphate guanylyltransferase [Oceanicella sp. SM1341]|uniref:bifunctional adenosylcobinamide kinase/adenosylcobinamide-phosphate guanylyltransferase n=1 Tax=Oceanicella sp. SM1341 TaxID=1548889 RepID=UPI0018E51923|nr:bifunctional adenosylcobinamide kinase/adenosylcobinamide-phosphate guanylyltransferase [Oceanicella sp. SM1341]